MDTVYTLTQDDVNAIRLELADMGYPEGVANEISDFVESPLTAFNTAIAQREELEEFLGDKTGYITEVIYDTDHMDIVMGSLHYDLDEYENIGYAVFEGARNDGFVTPRNYIIAMSNLIVSEVAGYVESTVRDAIYQRIENPVDYDRIEVGEGVE